MPAPQQELKPSTPSSAAPEPPTRAELDQLREENRRLRELLTVATSGHGVMRDPRGMVQPIRPGRSPSSAVRPPIPLVARPAEGRYRLVRRLGEGGMAEVYLGVAESVEGFSRPVAIKRILPSHSWNPQFRDMFLDEAKLSLSLQHAGIVQVFDVGHADKSFFIVMEYVDGVDLRQILQWRHTLGSHVPVRHAVNIALELCAGLAYAHELVHPQTGEPLRLVHRDITPSNVLISRQGEVKILDFGVAKTTDKVAVTGPGIIKGKLGYLAPETALGKPIDHRADIYAVGILLYEMLCSRRLFFGKDDVDTVLRARHPEIPSIVEQNPAVHPELERVVLRALAPDRERRYASAADLADDLAGFAYAHNLKITKRDVAGLVRSCLVELGREGAPEPRTPSPVRSDLQEEVAQFESILLDASMIQRNETVILSELDDVEVVGEVEAPPPVPGQTVILSDLDDVELVDAEATPPPVPGATVIVSDLDEVEVVQEAAAPPPAPEATLILSESELEEGSSPRGIQVPWGLETLILRLDDADGSSSEGEPQLSYFDLDELDPPRHR